MPIKSKRQKNVVAELSRTNPEKKGEKPTKRPDCVCSTFLVTINTNKAFKHDASDLGDAGDKFKEISDEYLERMEKDGSFILFHDDDGEWTEEKIKSIKSSAAIERSKKGLVHAHLTIEIKHRTKLHINIPTTKKFFLKKLGDEFGIKNVYVNVKFYKKNRSPSEVIDAYIKKNITKSGEGTSSDSDSDNSKTHSKKRRRGGEENSGSEDSDHFNPNHTTEFIQLKI